MKNMHNALAKATGLLMTKHRIAMTGSPLSNRLSDYLNLLDWVRPGLFGYPDEYMSQLCKPIQGGMNESGTIFGDTTQQNLQRIINKASPALHRRTISSISKALKGKTEFLIKVPLTELQLRIYEGFLGKDRTYDGDRAYRKKTLDQIAREKERREKNGGIWMEGMLLRALCNHPEAFKDLLFRRFQGYGRHNRAFGSVRHNTPGADADTMPMTKGSDSTTMLTSDTDSASSEDGDRFDFVDEDWFRDIYQQYIEPAAPHHSNKIRVLLSILQHCKEIGDKALLFTHDLASLDYLENATKKAGLSLCRLDGSVVFNERRKGLEDFNSGAHDVYLISTKAGGVGLNLQTANRIIVLDNDWSPMWEQQAIGRSYRMGQKKEVFVYHLMCEGSVETKLASKKYGKLRLADILIDNRWEPREVIRGNCDLVRFRDAPAAMKAKKELEGDFWSKDVVLDMVAKRFDPSVFGF